MKIWWLPQRQWPSRRRRRQQQQSSSSILSAFQFEGFTVALLPASIWLTHHQRAEIRPCCCIPSSASHYENSSALQTCTTYGPLSSLCGPWRLFGNNIYFKELAIFFFFCNQRSSLTTIWRIFRKHPTSYDSLLPKIYVISEVTCARWLRKTQIFCFQRNTSFCDDS